MIQKILLSMSFYFRIKILFIIKIQVYRDYRSNGDIFYLVVE